MDATSFCQFISFAAMADHNLSNMLQISVINACDYMIFPYSNLESSAFDSKVIV